MVSPGEKKANEWENIKRGKKKMRGEEGGSGKPTNDTLSLKKKRQRRAKRGGVWGRHREGGKKVRSGGKGKGKYP